MATITDFLHYDSVRYGTSSYTEAEYGFQTEIIEIANNRYCLLKKPGEQRHWQLVIKSVLTDCETGEVSEVGRLTFNQSAYSKPDLESFSAHIRRECLATLEAVDATSGYVWGVRDKVSIKIDDITPQEIYSFTKQLHMNYSNTCDFLEVVDHYGDRLRANLKFIDYMIHGSYRVLGETVGDLHATGEHFTAFLGVGSYYDHYE